MTAKTDRLLTKDEAADRLGMHPRTFERRIMPRVKVWRDGSRLVRIPESEVDRVIEERARFDVPPQ